jgi:alpha-mannosidase
MFLSLLKCTALKEGYGDVGGFNHGTKTSDGYEIGVKHEFDYALSPHIGDWKDANLVQNGIAFNNPLVALKAASHAGKLPRRLSLLTVSAPNVIVTAVRATKDGIVVRVYESSGCATKEVEIRTAFAIESAFSTNLIEQQPKKVDMSKDLKQLKFDIGAFEIKTFVLKVGGIK